MPSWNEVLSEIQVGNSFSSVDFVRRKYIKQLNDITGRNVICYYSGFLQKPGLSLCSITDDDKNGFMSAVCGLDRSLGLDLIIHTPGGDIAATESIVNYLRKMFDTDIRIIVPQIAMSAGTMICCSGKEIIMGKESNLGPIDPQFGGISCQGVLEEFEQAVAEITSNPRTIPLWQTIIGKYHPTFIGDCNKAIEWSNSMVKSWLKTGMFLGDSDADDKADNISNSLGSHTNTKNHSRHIHMEECEAMGLKIIKLEDYMQEQNFQDIVLTIHHAFMHTFSMTPSAKIVENHEGRALVLFSN